MGSERNMMRHKCDGPQLGHSSGSQRDIFVPRGHLAISGDFLVVTACG